MKRFTEIIALSLIILLGLFTRILWLDTFPPGLQNDEASFLYNAHTIATTGQDEDGRTWPMYLHSYIDSKPALVAYTQIPFIAALGTNAVAARLPMTLFAVASIGLLYLLLKQLKLLAKQRLLLILLITLSPWHIVISRATQEVIVAFAFGLGALLALQKYLNSLQERQPRIPLALTFFGLFLLSAYSYHSSKVVLPLLIIGLLIKNKLWQRNKITMGLIIVITAVLAAAPMMLSPANAQRLQAVSIFSNDAIVGTVANQISTASPHTPLLIIRAFYNKVIATILLSAQNYAEHFTASFLIFSGDQPMRYNIPFHGLLFYIELPLLIFGILAAFARRKKTAITRFFLWWLLIAPIPAMVTNQEIPSSIRSFWLVVPIYYFVSFAIIKLVAYLQQLGKAGKLGKTLQWSGLTAIALAYIWNIAFFWQQALVFFPHYQPWYRNHADQVMAQKLVELTPQYNQVVINRFSGQPYIYLALEGLISAETLQSTYPRRTQSAYSFGKYTFVNQKCHVAQQEQTLFLVEDVCKLPKQFKAINHAHYLDGNNGYAFVEYQATQSAAVSGQYSP